MVEDIIKAVNHSFVYVSRSEFEIMTEICGEKLLACSQRHGGRFEAFFDCLDCDERQLITLLKICEQAHTLFLGFVSEKGEKEIKVLNRKIYPGERLIFEEDVMIFQDIPFDCYLECYGNLIVLGKIKGCIDFYHRDCYCVASSLQQARIRIFDSQFHKLTSFSSSVLYYENGQIMREEKTWEVALGSPLEKAV
jgi:hypothetical protein